MIQAYIFCFWILCRVEKYANLPAEELTAPRQPAEGGGESACPAAAHAPFSLPSSSSNAVATQCPRDASAPAAAAASAAAPSSRSAPSVVEEMDMDAMLQALEELEETRRQK